MKKSWLPLAALALMASCSSDEVNTPVDLTDTPITVNASVNPISASLKLNKVDNSSTSDLPAQFNLKITNPDKQKYCYDAVMKPVTEGESTTWKSYMSDGTTELLMLWADSDTKVDVKASTFEISDNGTAELTANADQTKAENLKTSDYLMCDIADQKPTTEGISLLFNHVMTKLNIVITLGNEYNGTASPITAVSVNGTKATGNFDRTKFSAGTAWSFADATTATEVKAYDSKKFVAYDATTKACATAQYEVILVPQTVASGSLKINMAIGEKNYVWTSTEELTLVQGTCYEVKLKAGKDKVSSADFTQTGWDVTTTPTDLTTD